MTAVHMTTGPFRAEETSFETYPQMEDEKGSGCGESGCVVFL